MSYHQSMKKLNQNQSREEMVKEFNDNTERNHFIVVSMK